MVSRTYFIRPIDPADRAFNALQIQKAEARGDYQDVPVIKESFAQWERDQGRAQERLVCAVCGSIWLQPTSNGIARPHTREKLETPTWDRVRELRKEIKTLQTELDRVLDSLEG